MTLDYEPYRIDTNPKSQARAIELGKELGIFIEKRFGLTKKIAVTPTYMVLSDIMLVSMYENNNDMFDVIEENTRKQAAIHGEEYNKILNISFVSSICYNMLLDTPICSTVKITDEEKRLVSTVVGFYSYTLDNHMFDKARETIKHLKR